MEERSRTTLLSSQGKQSHAGTCTYLALLFSDVKSFWLIGFKVSIYLMKCLSLQQYCEALLMNLFLWDRKVISFYFFIFSHKTAEKQRLCRGKEELSYCFICLRYSRPLCLCVAAIESCSGHAETWVLELLRAKLYASPSIHVHIRCHFRCNSVGKETHQ